MNEARLNGTIAAMGLLRVTVEVELMRDEVLRYYFMN